MRQPQLFSFSRILCLAAFALGAVTTGEARAQTTVQVIVHSSNPVTALSTADVEAMFLKRNIRWDHGGEIVPVDMPEQSPVRNAFSQQIHHKATAAIEAYWQRQVFSGRGVPPVQRGTPGEVIGFVAGTPGAIGYVPNSTTLPGSVKEVRIRGAGEANDRIYAPHEVDEPPQALRRPAVQYPARLRQRGVEGSVVLRFVVTTDGTVDANSIEVMEATNQQFSESAERAIRRMAFTPGRVRGELVAVRVQQTVAFELNH